MRKQVKLRTRPEAPRRGIIRRLSYANVIATVALFVALGGGAYAVSKLPAKSVGSKQIKKNAVVSTKVKDSSLLGKDFKPGELPRGAAGATGATGGPGAAGPPGATGPPGPSASSFSSHDPAPVLIGGTDTQVIALTDGTDGSSGGLLTVGFDGRILVNGSIGIFNGGPNGAVVACRLNIAPQNGSYVPISKYAGADMPSGSRAQVPLVGAVDQPAGTYNVNAVCQSGASGIYFEAADLTALATAR